MRPAPKLSPDYEYLYKMGGFLNWMGPNMVQFIDLLVVFERETNGSGVPHFTSLLATGHRGWRVAIGETHSSPIGSPIATSK